MRRNWNITEKKIMVTLSYSFLCKTMYGRLFELQFEKGEIRNIKKFVNV